jgi:flagellar FliJ protein
MGRSTTMDKLLDVARKRTDHAARSLASLNAREHDAQQQLELLIAYRDDYFVRFHETAANGIEQDTLHNFQAFMQKLDAAIEEQRRIVADTRHGVNLGQNRWRAERQRMKSYDVLVERGKVAEGREQQEQDEYAAKLHQRKKASA